MVAQDGTELEGGSKGDLGQPHHGASFGPWGTGTISYNNNNSGKASGPIPSIGPW